MSRKIPHAVRLTKAIALGHYAIFCKTISTAIKLSAALYKKDVKRGIPAYGQITYKGKKYWYCRVGFVNDNDIYAKPKTSKQ